VGSTPTWFESSIAPFYKEISIISLRPENETDKQRFEKMKHTEQQRGRDEDTAIDVAAREVKELRER
jgi:hypothetical protein